MHAFLGISSQSSLRKTSSVSSFLLLILFAAFAIEVNGKSSPQNRLRYSRCPVGFVDLTLRLSAQLLAAIAQRYCCGAILVF